MQQIILDEQRQEPDYSNVQYSSFLSRLGALILDGIITVPVVFGLTYINIISWKSGAAMALIAILTTAYKPYMEYTYGATLGKMALGLKVTNLQFKKADIGTILYRNVFNIAQSLLSIVLTFGMYSDAQFQDVNGLSDFVQYSAAYSSTNYIDYIFYLIVIVEAIMLGTDKWSRSLHDRIAGTFVIVK